MAAGDTGLSAIDPSQFGSDVAYSGLADSSFGFSGDSSLESGVGLQEDLPLDISGGPSYSSTYDFWGVNDPQNSLALSGVTDPPFISASLSTPNPYGMPLSDNTSAAFGFMSKLGSIFGALAGGTSRAVSPSPLPMSQMRVGLAPTHHQVSGSNLAMLLIIVGAVALILARGD